MTNKLLTIGIRRYLVTQPRNKRTRKAAYYIRERISHYMKIEMDKVRFGKDLNNAITARAKQMKPVKLNIEIDKGIAIGHAVQGAGGAESAFDRRAEAGGKGGEQGAGRKRVRSPPRQSLHRSAHRKSPKARANNERCANGNKSW